MSVRRPRLIAVASHPIQYFVPLYREIAGRGRVALRVVYCRDFGTKSRFDKQFGRKIRWDVDLLSGYDHRFLHNVSPVSDTFNPLHAVNPGVVEEVLSGADAVWLNGIFYPTNWLAIAASVIRDLPLFLRSDLREEKLIGGVREECRRIVYSRALPLFERVFYIGTTNRRAYERADVTARQLLFTPFSVDLAPFDQLQPSDREGVRAGWGARHDDVVVLFLGKLGRNKHPEFLFALDRARSARSMLVVFAGSGELESEIANGIKELRVARGRAVGFVNQSSVPRTFAGADVFVFPATQEAWGLTLNEAMAAGIPSVVSSGVGAAEDLVVEGETGFVFRDGDVSGMVEAVDRLAADSSLRARMGAAARDRIRHWSPAACAEAIEDAVLESVSGRSK